MSRPVHFELQADNPDRAIAFYSALFGWQFKNWGGPHEYWLITTGPDGTMGINGGMIRRSGPAPAADQPANGFVCTLGVENLDELLLKVPAAGGTIAMGKMPIPGVGWLAYIKDTEGNLVGMMQPDMNAR